MFTRPLGWLCGELLSKVSGHATVVQRAALGIVEEAKDEFPNLTLLVQSQKREPVLKRSRSIMSKVMSIHNGEDLANGMTNIFKFSRSTPQHLRTQLLPKMGHRKSHQLMIAKAQIKPSLLMERDHLINAIYFPARTVISNLVYASYAIITCMAAYSKMAVGLLKNFTLIQSAQRQKDGSINNQSAISKHNAKKARLPFRKNNAVLKRQKKS
ncbi:spermatogenesis-associated protein 9-like [Scyliorhinus canicula]|uniref:spermatogenesis-associated protein 9-like n=1 Tax=Scyliorhinus canicula TaxID=7830 RepID=UPI0018F5015E|nr:spermatogenesis-associated protein 9-like [Scyliorhinus canicula]